jgi:hypothetical protein
LVNFAGYNYSAFLSPVLFTCAAIVWRCVADVGVDKDRRVARNAAEVGMDENAKLAALERADMGRRSIIGAVGHSFKVFVKSFYLGAFIIGKHRRFAWLVTGYSVALYGHRYLENG